MGRPFVRRQLKGKLRQCFEQQRQHDVVPAVGLLVVGLRKKRCTHGTLRIDPASHVRFGQEQVAGDSVDNPLTRNPGQELP